MSDLGDVIRQRDELNRQISAAQRSAEGEFEDRLDELDRALTAYAGGAGLTLSETRRKNVVTVGIEGGRVCVDFGHFETGSLDFRYSGSLAVRTASGVRADFGEVPPPVKAFIALVDGLLNGEDI